MTKFIFLGFLLYRKKISLEFHRFADDKFAKCKSLVIIFLEIPQWQLTKLKVENQNWLIFYSAYLTITRQVAKLNSLYIFIL